MFRNVLMVILLAGVPLSGSAQSSATIARLTQDVQLLQEQLGRTRLQVENLQRQQDQLLSRFESLMQRQTELTTSYQSFIAQTETKLDDLPAREAAMKREIVAEVSKQINGLALETQKAIDALAEARSATPQVEVRQSFSDDFPQTGTNHEVKRGETISGIAREYGSTIRDIMNANRIANATGLKAGETIFIPIPQE